MSDPLIDRAYLELVTQKTVPAEKYTDCDSLIVIASNLVRNYCRQPNWDETTAPEPAKVATARLVDSALYGSDSAGATKVEQVGDYRHEWAVAQTPYGSGGPLDITLVASDLDALRIRSYSVVTPQEFPNELETEEVV